MTAPIPRFVEVGRGDATLVLVHGAGGNHTHWGFQLRGLAESARLIAVDLPGHRRSQEIPDVSIDAYAGAVARVVEEARATRVVAVGHSMGGAIALTLALRRAPWLSGIVLVATGAKLRVSPAFLEGLQQSPDAACREILDWAVGPDCPASIRERALADFAACPPSVFLDDFRACDRFDVRDRLAEISVPALVACGSDDRMTPPHFSEFLAHRIDRASLEIVPGSGHMLMIEKPEALNAAIQRWLAEKALLRP